MEDSPFIDTMSANQLNANLRDFEPDQIGKYWTELKQEPSKYYILI